MRYDIRLTIGHHYSGQVGTGRHILRLFPAEIPGRQTVQMQRLTIDPGPVEQYDFRDFFGNFGTVLVHDTPHNEMIVGAVATVTCHNTRTPELNIAPLLRDLPQDLGATTRMGAESPHHFLGASPRISGDTDMATYAAGLVQHGATTRDAVLAIGQALHRDLKFDTLATSVDTSAQEAFRLRRGVCQDFTHIMITCLRELGIPAGYVSGFLRTVPPEGQERLDGADAMHAWVRAWCGVDTGWIEFDPTNGVQPSQDHIVVANGRDYSDISPVRGVLKTAGSKITTQAVDVLAV